MALVSYGAIITDARGKVGGSVLSRVAAGNVIRNKSIPFKKNTEFTGVARNNWKFFMQYWKLMSNYNKGLWETYAANYTFHNKLGVPVAAAANVIFAMYNYYYYQVNTQYVMVPPGFVAPDPTSLNAVSASVDSFNLALYFTATSNGNQILVSISQPYYPGKTVFNQRRLRYLGLQFVNDDNNEFVLNTLYDEKKIIRPVPGQYSTIAFRRVNPDTGDWSPLTYFEFPWG